MRHRPTVLLASGLLCCVLLSSCFTASLWLGNDGGLSLTRYSSSAETSGGGRSVWEKLALTPVTLLLDAITLPIVLLLSDTDDDGWPRESSSRAERASQPPPGPSRPNPRTDGHAATRASGGETPVLQPRRD